MPPNSHDPHPSIESHALLSQPSNWLPMLGSGEDAEFFFFAYDLSRRLTYLSDSGCIIFKVQQTDWANKPLEPILTSHAFNLPLAKPDSELEPQLVHRMLVEVLDCNQKPVQVVIWRRLLLHLEKPVGVVGMGRLHGATSPDSERTGFAEVDPKEIRRRFATLTARELQVVQLVAQGDLNKAIAKKLEVSMRTVEARRSKAMGKLGVQRPSELVRFWILAQESPQSDEEK